MNKSSEVPRRELAELIVKYQLEPSLRDLYVEGPQDKALYQWYLEDIGCKDVAVYEIDSVEITQEITGRNGLGNGNRNRIMALALELDKRFPTTLSYVKCIADRDFDFLLGLFISANHLLYTDYTSVDMYSYNDQLISKALLLGLNLSQDDAKGLTRLLSPVLKELFIIRATFQALNWNRSCVRFTRCCTVDGAQISFDTSEFIVRTLNSASKITRV